MTKEQEKKLFKHVAVAGIVLGLLCSSLPPKYQAACHFLANVCSGNL